MPTPQKALTPSADTWTEIADFSGAPQSAPRSYAVVNHGDSANLVEVHCDAIHGEGGGDEPAGEGVPVLPGQAQVFTAFKPGGGRHTRVWVRSAGATLGHGVVMG